MMSEKNSSRNEIKSKANKKMNSAWSAQKERKDERRRRQDRKMSKRTWLKSQNSGSMTVNVTGKRSREEADDDTEQDSDDWAELVREEKVMKRLRMEDLSRKEPNAEFENLDG